MTRPEVIEEEFSIKIVTLPPDDDIIVVMEDFPMLFFVITKQEQLAVIDLCPGGLHMSVQLHAQKLVETFARMRNFGLTTRDLCDRME
jgi:hypothetical protein